MDELKPSPSYSRPKAIIEADPRLHFVSRKRA
jgi:hypothetical protein